MKFFTADVRGFFHAAVPGGLRGGEKESQNSTKKYYICMLTRNLLTKMKRILLLAATGLTALSALAQPQLRKDNIDEVLKAMTL